MVNYEWLISRLDAFIRKYYANQVIRGTLIFLICLLCYILTVSVGEYYLYLSPAVKITIVSLFVVAGLSALVVWIAIPLLKMARLGKVISHEQAAAIVGRHFPEISDRLLNILQLRRQADSVASSELIEAGINQKISQISVVPITRAVDLSKNKKYIPYLLPLVLVGIFIVFAAPNVFRDASSRLLQPTKAFEKPAPFQFVVQSMPLHAVRNTDFTLSVMVKGDVLPTDMMVAINEDKLTMQSSGKHTFTYTFRNVSEPVQFRLYAAGYYSQPYTLSVVPKPLLKAFNVRVDYPDYTGRKDEVRNSLGDMTLPVGTRISWAFVAEHTDDAYIRFGNGEKIVLPKSAAMYGYQYRFMNDTAYTFILRNRSSIAADSFNYHVQVIPDQYPVIQVQEYKDTVSGKQVLLSGTAGDDYGISRIAFQYSISEQGKTVASKSIPLNAGGGALATFQHYVDIQSLNLQPGQQLTCYIEAWDNDGVHGAKSARSEAMTYKMYDAAQIDSSMNANAKQINSGISNSAQRTQQLQNDYKEMQSKMLQSDKMDWHQQQSLQDMMQQQQQLKDQLENIKKRFDEQVRQSEQKQYSDDLKDKQDAMQKQLDNLLNNELKEQMKKLQELMQKLNKDDAFKTMKQLEQENKLFNMDMQRMQELMKKMEMQMRMEDLANKMDALAQKQDQLKKETEQSKKDNATLTKEQQQLKNELDKAMQQDMKEMQQLNSKMQQEQSLDQPQEQGEQAQENMQQGEQQLNQQQNSKASQSQSKASQNMKNMADALRKQAAGMDVKQIELDIKATRQLLTNLIRLSFDQEGLMKRVGQTSPSSQAYLTNQQEQSRLRDNAQMIKDSLFVLSKRVFQLAATVNKETTELENNMSMSIGALEKRRVSDATTRQQYVMTHVNNLALMLNELLSNLMQQQSQTQQSGQAGSCSNPGGAKPKSGAGKMKDIITGQQDLGNAMQQMQNAQQRRQGQGKEQGQGEQGEKGENGKDGKNGQQGGQKGNGGNSNGDGGEYGDAEQLARLAAQQATLRRQLQELSSLLNSKGMGNSKELRDIQQKMDKNETDLVNRRTNSSEFMQRQREILTRLLEAEKSIREQEEDDKRSSNTAKEISRPVPPELQKYIKNREQLLELYKTAPPQLKPYYRQLVDQYYKMIGK